MPGTKRKNQNSPGGWKEKHPLVLPKVNAATRAVKDGAKSALPARQSKALKVVQKNEGQPAHNPGSLLTQKTYEDFNKQQPNAEYPNSGGNQKAVEGADKKVKKSLSKK